MKTVVHLPVYYDNPYQSLIISAQRERGWRVIEGGGGGNFIRTAVRDWKPDILHLHWLHPYLIRQGRIASQFRSWRFVAEITALKHLGARVIWTAHNLANHSNEYPELESRFTKRITKLCSLIFTHGQFASSAIRSRYSIPPRIPIAAVQHPCYATTDDVPTMEAARTSLRLPQDDVIIGFVGRIEPYKQVAQLIDAFRRIPRSDVKLVIRGRCPCPVYFEELLEAIAGDSRVMFLNEYVPEEIIPQIVCACNVIACPSKGILTSGSVMLPLSYRRPVIAARDGCIPEQVGPCGILYSPGDPEDLHAVIRQSIQDPSRLREMGDAAVEHCADATPERTADRLIEGYDSVLNCRMT